MKRESEAGASPYARAYKEICNEFEGNKRRPLTKSQVQSRLESTPGLRFPVGTTLDEIVGLFDRWKIIAYIQPFGYKEKVIIPLDKDSPLS